MTVAKKTLEYYDWNEVTDEVERISGKEVRDWAGKFKGNPDAEYQDFWHILLNHYEIHNGCYIEVWFDNLKETYSSVPWILEVINYYEQVVDTSDPTFGIWW